MNDEQKKEAQRAMTRERVRRWREKKEALQRLSEDEVKQALTLTPDDLRVLQEIIEKPGRNALAQLNALRMKAMFTLTPPKQEVGMEGVTVTVNTVAYPLGLPETATATVTATGPIIRKGAALRQEEEAEEEVVDEQGREPTS